MSRFTANSIFDLLKEGRVLINPVRGGFRFDRRERVEAVYPDRLCAQIASRSASYYSWFLNMDRQGAPIRDSLRRLFEEDAFGVVREMTDKCARLLEDSGEAAAAEKRMALHQLSDPAGRAVPLFVRGSEAAGRLDRLLETAPERALAWLFLTAGMDGCTPAQYERLRDCWRLLDRVRIWESSGSPLQRLKAAELLEMDGDRAGARQMLEQTAESLRQIVRGSREQASRAGGSSPDDLSLLGTILFRLGMMYLGEAAEDSAPGEKADGGILKESCREPEASGGDADGRTRALVCLRESAACGCPEACGPLAALEIEDGKVREAAEVLERGAAAGSLECLRMLGNACYRGEDLAGGRRDPARAGSFYLAGACPEDPASGDALCQYMLARILEEEPALIIPAEIPFGKKEPGRALADPADSAGGGPEKRNAVLAGARAEPAYWYAAAARLGNADAAARLNRLRWQQEGGAFKDTGKAAGGRTRQRKRICLLNSSSEKNILFASSLPADTYTVLFCEDNSGSLKRTSLKSSEKADGRTADKEKAEREKPGTVYGNGTMAQMLARIGNQYLELAACGRTGAAPDRSLDPELLPADISVPRGMDPAGWLCEVFPEILCIALDGEEEKNIQDSLQLIRQAFLLHERSAGFMTGHPGYGEEDDKDREDRLFYLFSDRVRIYVLAEEDYAGPLFDSACSRLGDFYLPLYLCDPAKLVSAELLDRLPLFLPCLEDRDWHRHPVLPMHVAVFGDHPGIVQLCRDILAAAQIEDPDRFPFSLTVIGENAEDLEEAFAAACPGIMDPPVGCAVQAPLFISMKPESRAFQNLLRETGNLSGDPSLDSEDGRETIRRIRTASYLIVYTKEEKRNLTLAMYLREWYLKTDRTFRRLPLIACYCRSAAAAGQLDTLSPGGEASGNAWFNNYRIRGFGREDRLYSYSGLIEDRLEECALRSHFSYYTFTEREDRFRAEHDYFAKSYNRDSSRMNALSIPYRLFSAGIAFADGHDYAEDVSRDGLADRFDRWLAAEELAGPEDPQPETAFSAGPEVSQPETAFSAGPGTCDRNGETRPGLSPRVAALASGMVGKDEKSLAGAAQEERRNRLERMAVYEHGRWVRSMLSRGWLPASVDQMLAYIQRGSSRHQLYIAKLHPFLCSWDRLGEAGPEPTGLQREYNAIMRQIRPDRDPADIRGIDWENVLKTGQILRRDSVR